MLTDSFPYGKGLLVLDGPIKGGIGDDTERKQQDDDANPRGESRDRNAPSG